MATHAKPTWIKLGPYTIKRSEIIAVKEDEGQAEIYLADMGSIFASDEVAEEILTAWQRYCHEHEPHIVNFNKEPKDRSTTRL